MSLVRVFFLIYIVPQQPPPPLLFSGSKKLKEQNVLTKNQFDFLSGQV